MKFDAELLIPDESLSIDEGAIVGMGWQSSKDEGSFCLLYTSDTF